MFFSSMCPCMLFHVALVMSTVSTGRALYLHALQLIFVFGCFVFFTSHDYSQFLCIFLLLTFYLHSYFLQSLPFSTINDICLYCILKFIFYISFLHLHILNGRTFFLCSHPLQNTCIFFILLIQNIF